MQSLLMGLSTIIFNMGEKNPSSRGKREIRFQRNGADGEGYLGLPGGRGRTIDSRGKEPLTWGGVGKGDFYLVSLSEIPLTNPLLPN